MDVIIGQIHGTDDYIGPGQAYIALYIRNKVVTLDNVYTFNVKAETLPEFDDLTPDPTDADDQQVLAKGLDTGQTIALKVFELLNLLGKTPH